MVKKEDIKLPSMKGQRVLITGGLGFVGSNLAHTCLNLGAEVIIYDCLDPKSGGNLYNISDIKKNVEVILNDIRNFEGVCSAVLNKDIIFCCAAYTSHSNSMKEPLIDIDVNCKGTINILEAARRFNPDVKIVHIGTSTQVGKMRGNIIDENHTEFAVDIYSANKSASEKYVLIYGSAYKMRTTVIRLANNFGPRSCINSADFGFTNYFIGLALQNKEISVFGKGDQMRNLSFIEDSVNALVLASQTEKANGETFFAVSDNQITVMQIAQAITNTLGGEIKNIAWPEERELIEIGDAVISNKKIKERIGWRPVYSLEEGLRITQYFYSPILNKYL